MTTFTFVNKHKMSDSESDYSEGSEVSRDPQAIGAREVKRYIGEVLSEVLGCIRYGKAVYERTENEALKKYWHDTIGNVEKQAESLKNLPESAEIDFSKLPLEEDYYHIEGLVYFTLKQMVDEQSELKTVDEFAHNNKNIQRELDRLSIALMPASAQAVIDQIITTLATPLPEDIAKTAKTLDDRVMKFDPSLRSVDATEYLRRIVDESEWAQFSTGRMEAWRANDFVNGAYEKRAAEMYEAKKAGKPEGYNTEGDRSYAVSTAALATSRFRRYIGADFFVKRIVQSLKIVTWNWETVTAMLPDTSELLKLRAAYYSVGSPSGQKSTKLHKLTEIRLPGKTGRS